jgi:20S proteasome alpha/beta subunit
MNISTLNKGDLSMASHHSSPKSKHWRKIPVTIIVGLICDDSIIVASDSQTTYGGSSKRIDTDKMHQIEFANAHGVLVAQAGDAAITSRLIELMASSASGVTMTSPSNVTNCAESAVRILKREIIEHLEPAHRSINEIQDYYRTKDAALMLAFYQNNEPKIYTLDFNEGIAFPAKSFATAGCGATVADYILSAFDTSKMNFAMGNSTAIYIIEEVKKVDAFCDGPAKIAFLMKASDKNVRLAPKESVAQIVDKLRERDVLIKAQWADNLFAAIAEAANEWSRTIPTSPPPPSGQSPDVGPSTTPPPAPGHPSNPPTAPTPPPPGSSQP